MGSSLTFLLLCFSPEEPVASEKGYLCKMNVVRYKVLFWFWKESFHIKELFLTLFFFTTSEIFYWKFYSTLTVYLLCFSSAECCKKYFHSDVWSIPSRPLSICKYICPSNENDISGNGGLALVVLLNCTFMWESKYLSELCLLTFEKKCFKPKLCSLNKLQVIVNPLKAKGKLESLLGGPFFH